MTTQKSVPSRRHLAGIGARALLSLSVPLVLAFVGLAMNGTLGSWAVSGSGNGASKALAAQALTLADASASTSAQLYPGGSGDVILKVSNPNPFAVTITDVVSAGTITSDKGAACNAATGVALIAQHALSKALTANAVNTVITLTGAATMSNASDNSCQGAVFTVPVTVTATS